MHEHDPDHDMVKIDERILDTFIIASGLTIDDLKELGLTDLNKSIQDEPNFEANINFGEGIPNHDELDYRDILVKYLEPIYGKTLKLLIDKETLPADKIKSTDKLIDSFIKDAQKEVQSTIESRYQEGYDGMDTTLKEFDVDPPKQKKNQPRLDSLLRQQLMNIEDIGLVLRGRIRQIFNIADIASYYNSITPSSTVSKTRTYPSNWTQCMIDTSKEYPEMSEVELRDYCENVSNVNSAFNDSQNRLDQLGMFGWVESQKAGWLESGLFAAVTLSLAIDVDWITMGDSNVCEYCQDNEDNSPWSIFEIPEEHYGGRCKLKVAGVEFDA